MIAYFSANDLPNTAAALRAELKIGEDVFDTAMSKQFETLLERKWTRFICIYPKRQEIPYLPLPLVNTVLQVIDLESQVKILQAELNNVTPSSLSKRCQDKTSWLPSKPARYSLESDKHDITYLAFHPVYSTIASGDQGSVIKIWDWGVGELERTIKGHTQAITGIDFGGPKGHVLLVPVVWTWRLSYGTLQTKIRLSGLWQDMIIPWVRFALYLLEIS